MAKAKTATKKPVDVMDTLLGDAQIVQPKKTNPKKDQPVITLSDAEAATFDNFCMADAALKMAEGHQKGSKATILPVLTDMVLNIWCDQGRRTENPRIKTDNGTAIFQVRETLKFDLAANENGDPITVVEALMNAGFDEEVAKTISKEEFTETTELRFANISKLREDPTSKKVLDKLFKLVLEEFTPAERGILLEKVNHVTLKEGFLDRAVGHVDKDPVQLKSLFNVVRPTYLMSHIVWNGNLTDAVKSLEGKPVEEKKLPTVLPTITAIPAIFNSDDGKWRTKRFGTEAVLYMMEGDSEFEVLRKPCSGGESHAEQTCKKWLRDPDYRSESLAKKK